MQVSSATKVVPAGDGKSVLEVGGDAVFQLNSLGAVIWARLSEGLPTEEIVREIASRFDVSENRAASDVDKFVEALKKQNLVWDSFRTPNYHVELVWNKGIAARCEWRIPDEFPEGIGFGTVHDPAGHIAPPYLLSNLISHPETYSNIKTGDLVWVRLSWIKSFLLQVLPLIKAKFILVTADSDVGVPTPIMAEALQILEYSSVIHWYAQNCDGPGFMSRMSPIPIGIDFHTLNQRPLWGESISTPQQQEQELRSIRKDLPTARERIRKIYVDFAWQPAHLYRPAKRQQILAKILTNENVVFQSRPLPRRELWRKWGEYAFVLSPHGTGLDCHRTWEALACGHIVLVPSSPLDSLYEGLPVIPIQDWSELTRERLDSWLDQYAGCDIDEEKLTSRHWVDKMRTVARKNLNSADQ